MGLIQHRNVYVYGNICKYEYFYLSNSECTMFHNDTLTSINNTDKVRCHVPSSCDRLECCVYIQPVQRHTQVELHIDTCSYNMDGAIDNLRASYSLFNRDWGIFYHQTFQLIKRIVCIHVLLTFTLLLKYR